MVRRISRVCRSRGCGNTTIHNSGYCDTHMTNESNWHKYQQGKSRHQRGYGHSWVKIRKARLAMDNHICQNCIKKNITRVATTVDHVIPKAKGGTDDMDNLMSLCWPCHRSKTSTDSYDHPTYITSEMITHEIM